jgi:small conductance mechanosensitive channel
MFSYLVRHPLATFLDPLGVKNKFLRLFDSWSDDSFDFVRHDLPRIVGIVIVAFILTRLLRVVSRHLSDLSNRQGLPSAVRAQQLRTVASVTYSVGTFVIVFWGAMEILQRIGINVAPLLASAGIVGLAIGFGAQALVKDFINGFFILVENQYDIGDTVKIAGVQGTVEAMTLRRTVLRDGDGTVHNVPSSEIKVASNLTRDWTQLALRVSVAYGADSDRVIDVLQKIGEELSTHPKFSTLMVAKPEVPGIDKVTGDQVEYLLLVKTKPGAQDAIRRELSRRIKARFDESKIEPGNPNRIFLVDSPKT